MPVYTSNTPRANRTRRFGEGILATRPTYRLDCTLEDDAWWMEEARREEDRLIDRMYDAYRAQERMDSGYAPY